MTTLEVTPYSKIEKGTHAPCHVAIMMDGNRRWARERGLSPFLGHYKGSENIQEITEAAAEFGVKVLTLYAFSTENWKRSPQEVNYVMEVIKNTLEKQESTMIKQGVRLHTIGDLSYLGKDLVDKLESVKLSTASGETIDLVLAVNYGGRDDIVRAMKKIFLDVERGSLQKSDLTEKTLSSYLDTAKWPDPDLVIRTSGEFRVSNFLLWQISYSEVYITDVLWPDFTREHLEKAITAYQERDRRRGGC